MKKLSELINLIDRTRLKRLAIINANDKELLEVLNEAEEKNLISSILIGDKNKIKNTIKQNGLNIAEDKIIDGDVNTALSLIKENKVDFIMKGNISTDDLMREVLKCLDKKTLLSHVMIYEIPKHHKLLILTDGGLNPYPKLNQKVDIINNSVRVSKKLGVNLPKVAVLSATEKVSEKIESTTHGALLSIMNRRGQIKDCIIEGPLALDNAISKISANKKNINSEVSGDADILIVPNFEAGNLLGKAITYFGNGVGAGVIVGGDFPIILNSRASTREEKLYSIILGIILLKE